MINHRCYFSLRTAISFKRLRPTDISNKNWFATSARQDNSTIALLKRLRSETQVSITKAKEALQVNDNDYDKALQWLLEDAKRSGATRAEKVKGRIAKEGLIGIALREGGGAIVEVNSETDFVSRNKIFQDLVIRIATTALFLSSDLSPRAARPRVTDIPISFLESSPLLPHPSATTAASAPSMTVAESIVDTIGNLKENINLRRAAVVDGEGAIVANEDVKKLARGLARQVVGLSPKYIDEASVKRIPYDVDKREYLAETVLLNQDYLLGGGSVSQILQKAGEGLGGVKFSIFDFVRWECGEGIEKPVEDFATEVMKQANLSQTH
ncbi:5298_t:CDS:2 [Paraglomus occultum]|uniref:Elongation factor Ts, mitochondrial n=1 Tax=Paraglomus occultum TaxID=144539 RepID=A0A9N9FRK1_9GLOM|nr:5298_t:CDS:2 [Paraglomus occultum]